jgi:hypothetical protein
MLICIPNVNFAQNLAYIQGPYHKDRKVKSFNPSFEERGSRPSQGKQTDIHEAGDFLRAEEVVKYHWGLQVVVTLCMKPRNFKIEVFWIHGPT